MTKYAGLKLSVVTTLVGMGLACGPVSADVQDDDPKTLDADKDGIKDAEDNCVDVPNPDQVDVDQDGIGDSCDSLVDSDGDEVGDDQDNCNGIDNPAQEDGDMDGVGDVCDNCPLAPNDDQADSDSDGIGDACPCDACGPADWCVQHPTKGGECVTECPSHRQAADRQCCPLGAIPDGDGVCQLPDLHVDEGRLLSSLQLDTQSFTQSSCEYIEGCIQGTGQRTLLRFDTTTPNDGPGDLYLGDPAQESQFVYSPCHQHYHFESYAAYEVQDADGNVLAPGHKQAFCLMDFEPWGGGGRGRYHCGDQGIQAGWADTYYSGLDCQFVDITGLADGDYVLQIHVNYEEVLAEGDYSDNVLQVPFSLPLR